MKTLIILLFPLLSFGQRQTFEHGLKMQSGFYGFLETKSYCVFESFNGGKEIILKVKASKPIIGGVIITTRPIERFGVRIEGINRNGFYIVKLPFYMLDFWESADHGIKTIQFNIGKEFETIIINDKLTKLKEYAR